MNDYYSDARTDILIVGGSVGGCAAAMAATSRDRRVILTEETDWIGGQFTAQGVPPDEHTWIEQFGCTARYRRYRNMVRGYYREHYPLTTEARSDLYLNPGNGWVSRLCHEPKVGLAVFEQMLAAARAKGTLQVRLKCRPVAAEMDGDRVRAVRFADSQTGDEFTIEADYVLDATELGDLLPLANVEYVSGFESRDETGEPHALAGPAQPDNVQALTWVFAVGWDPEGNHVIDKPADYDFWKNYVPQVEPAWGGRLFEWTRPRPVGSVYNREENCLLPEDAEKPWHSLLTFRRIVCKDHYDKSAAPQEVAAVIWPQNDYFLHNIIDKPQEEKQAYLEEARQQSFSLLYWMQTEAPRKDGGVGYPGLFLPVGMLGTADGLAKTPYIRESRRIKAEFTITENDIGADTRTGVNTATFPDTVGVGLYHIDLHASTGGNNSFHLDCLPFEIPLGALIPKRIDNVIPACKNIGTTHLTNGAFRLHPVEWNVGEAAGLLAAFCLERNVIPRQVRATETLLADFQWTCLSQGFELHWPDVGKEGYWSAFDKRVLGSLPKGALPR